MEAIDRLLQASIALTIICLCVSYHLNFLSSVIPSRNADVEQLCGIPPENLLLTSQSYLDLLRIDKYLKVIIDFDARLVDTYRYQVALKERYQEELIQNQSQWQRNIFEVEKKKGEIKKVRETKRTLLRAIQNQKVVYRKLIGEFEERAKELQTFIDKLEREKSLFAYGTPKYDSLKGKLIPPVRGKVISFFKEKGQNGI